MRCLPYGPNALLVEFAQQADEHALRALRRIVAELEKGNWPGLREYVPGFTRILLEFEPAAWRFVREDTGKILERLKAACRAREPLQGPIREIPVRYDGPDLARVAEAHGLAIGEVIQIHSEPVYQVFMLGFAPGFPYLLGLDPRLRTPRLNSPRPRVEAGSVAIGGEHAGIYSIDSPGGWNILGKTDQALFSPTEKGGADMFFLKPGDRVKFVPSGGEGGR